MRPTNELDLVLKLGPDFDGDLDEASESYRFKVDAHESEILSRVSAELGLRHYSGFGGDTFDEVVARPLLDVFEDWLKGGKPGRPAIEAAAKALFEKQTLPAMDDVVKTLDLEDSTVPEGLKVKRFAAFLKTLASKDLATRLEQMVGRWDGHGFFELKRRRVGQGRARDRRSEPAYKPFQPPGRA
jgi:hypothetical protein